MKAETWIGLVGALAGAVVGGLVTFAVAHDQIRASADIISEQRQAASVGTARLMRQEFDAWADLMDNRVGADRYAKAKIRIGSALSPETRLQVASAVDALVWEKVARAASTAPLAERLANRQPNKARLLPNDRVKARGYRDVFRAASDALRTLATKEPS